MADEEINVAALSDEDFDKEFEAMMSTPVEDEPEVAEEVIEAEPTAEVEVEEPTETEEAEVEDPDEGQPEPEVEPEESEESTNEESEETPEVAPFVFDNMPMDSVLPMDIAVNGTKVKATMNELMTGFKQGMNYTQKMQELAPMRKSLNIMSENALSEADLNLLVEAKAGNKQALAKLIGDAGVDSLDLEPEEAKDYMPSNYGSEPASFEMESVMREIESDTVNSPKVIDYLETMAPGMKSEIADNPSYLKALYQDVSTGMYENVLPEMQKLAALNGVAPSIDLYRQAAQTVSQRAMAEVPVTPKADPVAEANRADKRNSAVSGTMRKAPVKKTFVNFDDLDDSDFEAEFKKMTGRAISDYA